MADPVQVRDLLPEDAYDGDDPFDVRLDTMERVVQSINDDDDIASRTIRRTVALRTLDRLGDEVLVLVDRVAALRRRIGEG
jgi:hypothetical protein